MVFFESLEQAPADPIFGLNARFLKDPRPNKVDLGAGVYKTEALKPYILPSVKQAEAILLEKEGSKDYLPIDGLSDYINSTQEIVFSSCNKRIYGAQTVGATAALRVGASFLKERGLKAIYLSNPTWANHQRIFKQAGLEVVEYDHLHQGQFNFKGFMDGLHQLDEKSIVLLHACCHNPTGLDPSIDEWEEIGHFFQTKKLFPFFDLSYQGFGDDLAKDVYPIRLFLERGLSFAVAISHAKNFGLYAERCGALYLVCQNEGEALRVGSHIKPIIRGLYSNPPCHGARVVTTILQEPSLRLLWEQELFKMRQRLTEMRKALVDLLHKQTDRFDRLLHQKGMFSFTGLDAHASKLLCEEYGIYLPEDGRINVAGLNQANLNYVAEAILKVLR